MKHFAKYLRHIVSLCEQREKENEGEASFSRMRKYDLVSLHQLSFVRIK